MKAFNLHSNNATPRGIFASALIAVLLLTVCVHFGASGAAVVGSLDHGASYVESESGDKPYPQEHDTFGPLPVAVDTLTLPVGSARATFAAAVHTSRLSAGAGIRGPPAFSS